MSVTSFAAAQVLRAIPRVRLSRAVGRLCDKPLPDFAAIYRELRATGRQNIWLCHMGSVSQDGSFADFQTRIKQLDFETDGLGIELTTLRGNILHASWNTPLSVNGVEQRVEDFKLCENPYCVAEVGDEIQDIRYQDYVMRLDFSIE